MLWLFLSITTFVLACIRSYSPSNHGPQLWGPRCLSVQPLYWLCLPLVPMVLLENSANSFSWQAPQVFFMTSKSWVSVSLRLSCQDTVTVVASLIFLPSLSVAVYIRFIWLVPNSSGYFLGEVSAVRPFLRTTSKRAMPW